MQEMENYKLIIYQPFGIDYKFEDGLILIKEGLSMVEQKTRNTIKICDKLTKVRLSSDDGENFDLKDFTYRSEGAHTYKIVNQSR